MTYPARSPASKTSTHARTARAGVSTWPLMQDGGHQRDGGFGALQALEIAYIVSNSRTVWFLAVDNLLISVGIAAASYLAIQSRALSLPWALFGFLTSAICGLSFTFHVYRGFSWTTFSGATAALNELVGAVLLPAWAISLGFQLRKLEKSDMADGLYQVATPSSNDQAAQQASREGAADSEAPATLPAACASRARVTDIQVCRRPAPAHISSLTETRARPRFTTPIRHMPCACAWLDGVRGMNMASQGKRVQSTRQDKRMIAERAEPAARLHTLLSTYTDYCIHESEHRRRGAGLGSKR